MVGLSVSLGPVCQQWCKDMQHTHMEIRHVDINIRVEALTIIIIMSLIILIGYYYLSINYRHNYRNFSTLEI